MREETIHCVTVLIVYRYILHLTPAFARHRVLHRADTLGSRQTSTRGVARTRPRPLGMSDYAEDQAMEVEALESILMEDMIRVDGSEGIDGATHAPCYQISVSALGDGEEEDPSDESQTARLGLVFSHTPNYPDEPPLLKCRSVKGLFDSELVAVHELLTKHAAESVGMAMIFDLVNEAREWMRTRAGVVDVVEETPEMLKQRLEEEAEARLRAMRATGTPVTPETFNAWVMRFEAERALARAKAGKRLRRRREGRHEARHGPKILRRADGGADGGRGGGRGRRRLRILRRRLRRLERRRRRARRFHAGGRLGGGRWERKRRGIRRGRRGRFRVMRR